MLNAARVIAQDVVSLVRQVMEGESGINRKGAKMPPFDVIASWCRRKGLPSDNSTVWAICRAFSLMDADEWSGRWLDMVFDELTKVLDNYFKD